MKKSSTYNGALFFLITLLLFQCGEDHITISEIVALEVPSEVTGDGTSKFKIRAILDSHSDEKLRKVKFSVGAGSFDEGTGPDMRTATADARFNDDHLVAEVTWKAPSTTGTVVVSAEPVLEGKQGLFRVNDSIDVQPSQASSISLSASAFSVANTFESEIIVTGILRNSNGGGVTSGTRVVTRDIFASDGAPVNGRYRSLQLSSNAASSISFVYSAGPIVPNQDILLVTMLDGDGSQTDVGDTLRIFVNELK